MPSCAHEALMTHFQRFSLAPFGAGAVGCCWVLVARCQLSRSGLQSVIRLPWKLSIAFPAWLGLFSLIEPVRELLGHS